MSGIAMMALISNQVCLWVSSAEPFDSQRKEALRGECPERGFAEPKGFDFIPRCSLMASQHVTAAQRVMPFFVYILQLADGRLYVGHTNALHRRYGEHEQGKGCRTTGLFGTGKIIHVEEYPDRTIAASRERQVKGWTHAKKLALAIKNLTGLHELAKRRGG